MKMTKSEKADLEEICSQPHDEPDYDYDDWADEWNRTCNLLHEKKQKKRDN